MKSRRSPDRRAMVLVIVLVVVAVLSLTAYTFAELMQAHRQAAAVSGKQIQARLLVDSGVDAVKMYLAADEASREEMGGSYHNPVFFQAAQVIPADAPIDRGSFTVLAPLVDEATGQTGVRYGLEDESTRLNLNLLLVVDQFQAGAGRNLLMNLPNMTEDVADAILDWIDADDEPREFGAEVDYYSALVPPYYPTNGPPKTVEELLLVRGVTPDLLFGLDSNRNGMQDANEINGLAGGAIPTTGISGATTAASASTSAASTAASSTFFRGWSPYLTLYSAERNTKADGTPRIFLNNTDLNQLNQELSAVGFDEAWVKFILAYRLYGPASGGGGGGGAAADAASLELDLSQQPRGTFAQVLDLIGKQVQVTVNGQQSTVNSPFASDPVAMALYLPLLMENCTASEGAVLPGRININQAPREILLGIPGMSEEIVEEIVSRRTVDDSSTDENRRFETWLAVEGLVTLDELRLLTPFICAGGDVFRAQIVGYFHGGGPSYRSEVIFDATGAAPRVLFWRDISHLGRGYALETLGVDLTVAAQP